MNPDEFNKDIKRSLNAICSIVKQNVIGFRAPSFTITKKTLWALPILKQQGIIYDSSVYPIGFHPDYGIAESDLNIHKLNGIMEVPLSVAEFGGKRFRVAAELILEFFLIRSPGN